MTDMYLKNEPAGPAIRRSQGEIGQFTLSMTCVKPAEKLGK
jgi:hypothetical protein